MTQVYQKRVREENLKRIFRWVHLAGTTHRSAIAKELGLSPSAVTNLTSELIEIGVIRENGFGQSFGGRRPAFLCFEEEWAWVVAVKIGVGMIHAGLANLNGELKVKCVETIQSHHPNQVVRQVIQLVHTLLPRSRHKIIGMGVCCPGVINTARGEVFKAVNLGWQHVPLQQYLAEHFEWPVFVEDVADTGALGEKWFGSGKGVENLIYVTLGNGIGSGIICHGELYPGHQHAAGEFGHMSVDFSGPQCSCGNRGCLEMYASAPAIVREVQAFLDQGGETLVRGLIEETGVPLTCETVDQAARQGDPFALEVWRKTGRLLGQAIGNLVTLFDPEMVVVGGGLSLSHQVFFQTLAQTVEETARPLHTRGVQVKKAYFGRDSGLVGAAALTIERIFSAKLWNVSCRGTSVRSDK